MLEHQELQQLAIYSTLANWHRYDQHALFLKLPTKEEIDYYVSLRISNLMQLPEVKRVKLVYQYFARRPKARLVEVMLLLNAVEETDKKVLSLFSQAIFRSTYTISDYLFLQKVWELGMVPKSSTINSTYRQVFRLLLENGKIGDVAERSPDIWDLYADLFGQQEMVQMVRSMSRLQQDGVLGVMVPVGD